MKTPQSWGEFLDQIMVRRMSFLVTFFVVTFVTYLILYVVDFYPEPPATTDTEAVMSDDTAEDETALDNIDTTTNTFSVTEPVTDTEALVVEAAPTPAVENTPAAVTNTVNTEETSQQNTGSAGIRDNIPDNLNVTEENGEVVIDLTTPEQLRVATAPATAVSPVYPNKIVIPALEKSVDVLNPTSRAISDLDAALLNGVVRHPDSADLANKGNVFILGHSSYLPNVLNRNFQAFNGIQKLAWGDEVKLQTASGAVYVYRVDRVYEAKASDVIVPTTPGEARLTLATCDSFGSKDDRFIVEASLLRVDAA